jgi:hypothetical protein
MTPIPKSRPPIPSPNNRPRRFLRAVSLLLAVPPILLAGCGQGATSPGGRADRFLTVSLPPVKLGTNESIQSVEMEIRAAILASINCVPLDWSIQSRWDSPDLILLKLQAGHFVSGLTAASGLDGFITVQAGDPSQFEIATRVLIGFAGPDSPDGRTNFLTRLDLVLKPCSPMHNRTSLHAMPSEFMERRVVSPRRASAGAVYLISTKGETFATVAKLHRISLSDLLALNPGSSDGPLRVGQKIRVRKSDPR